MYQFLPCSFYFSVWDSGDTLHDYAPERDGHPDPAGQGGHQAGQQVYTVQSQGKRSWLVPDFINMKVYTPLASKGFIFIGSEGLEK